MMTPAPPKRRRRNKPRNNPSGAAMVAPLTDQSRARVDVSKRAFNFCAGPAALPDAVLQRAQAEMLDWRGKGLSVMEMSHRSDDYVAIAEKAEQDLRDLLSVPSNYKVLFLQGGASQQCAQLPLNLLPEDGTADYIDTGIWSQKAIEEASRYGHVNVAATAKPYDYFAIPGQNEWNLSKDAAYVHYAPNETIGGLEFQWIPETGDVPLVADMSSDILSRPVDISRFGMIYAGAQKNIGPAGLTIVIVREDLLGHALPGDVQVQLRFVQQPHRQVVASRRAQRAELVETLGQLLAEAHHLSRLLMPQAPQRRLVFVLEGIAIDVEGRERECVLDGAVQCPRKPAEALKRQALDLLKYAERIRSGGAHGAERMIGHVGSPAKTDALRHITLYARRIVAGYVSLHPLPQNSVTHARFHD